MAAEMLSPWSEGFQEDISNFLNAWLISRDRNENQSMIRNPNVKEV
jgi:hypothetical protein